MRDEKIAKLYVTVAQKLDPSFEDKKIFSELKMGSEGSLPALQMIQIQIQTR